jgi:hypothetical protein
VTDEAGVNGTERAVLSREQMQQLIQLRWLWKGYTVNCDGATWTAFRDTDPDALLTADDHRELWRMIKVDNGIRVESGSRSGYWVETCSGPPYYVKPGSVPFRGRNSG